MAPPIEEFLPAQLEQRIQYAMNGKLRRSPVELEKCKLMEMVQYMCEVSNRNDPNAVVVCQPVVRLFRR
jgi:hypothetical protein